MKENNFKEYDDCINVALINLFHFILNKQPSTLILNNFDTNNEAHLAMLSIASLAHTIFNINFKIKINIFSYIKLNFDKKIRKWCGFCIKPKENEMSVDVNNFIAHIETSRNQKGIFSKIYDTYYK